MSVKKNLTVATLAALLAVPAFGATNVNAASQLNTPTGRLNHAYDGYPAGTTIYDGHGPGGAAGPSYMENGALGHGNDNSHPLVEIPAKYVHSFNPSANTYSDNWTNHVGSSIGRALMNKVKSLGGTYNSNDDTEVLNYGGHHYELTGTASGVLIDGHSATDAQALSMLNGNEDSSDTSNSSNNNDSSINHTNADGSASNSSKVATNDTSNSDSNANNSNSTQYTSKNSLPQTGENDGASKAMAMGAVTLGASASLMALAVAKKHKQNAELESITPTEPAVNSDNGKDNAESNADKSSYDMIMGDTFKSISNDLKQM